VTPAPWGPTSHTITADATKIMPIDDYERARLCVNICHGVSDQQLLMLRPGDLKALLRKKKPPEPALFDKGEPVVSAHKEAVQVWCDSWFDVYGTSWPFSGGKDGKIIAELLRICGDVPSLARVINRYLADRDEFVVKNRHSLGFLRSQLQRWLAEPVQPVAESPRDPIAESLARMLKKHGGAG
jgi:hypothetical protein